MKIGVQVYYYFTVFTIAIAPLRLAKTYSQDSIWFISQLLLLVGTIGLAFLLHCTKKILVARICGLYMLLSGVASIPGGYSATFSGVAGGWINGIWLACSILFVFSGILLLIYTDEKLQN